MASDTMNQRAIFRVFAVFLCFHSINGFHAPPTTHRKEKVELSLAKSSTNAQILTLDRRTAVATVFAASSTLLLPTNAHPIVSNTWKLPNSVLFPTLALNTVGLTVEETAKAMDLARSVGITHVDFHPGAERDGVALYLKENPRQGLFLTTKIRKPKPGTAPADAAQLCQDQIRDDLAALNLESVDMLMLRDSPDCAVMQAQYKVLEDALAAGHCRSIGIINYCRSSLECLLETAKIKPAVHYFLLHPGMTPDPLGLRSFGESRGIRTFAYGASGEPGPNQELLRALEPLATKYKKSPAEISARWILQSGAALSVRPTLNFGLGTSICQDDCAEGLKQRSAVRDWQLKPADMKVLDAMTNPNDNPTLFSSAGCPNAFVMPK